MPKLNKRLGEIRQGAVIRLWKKQTADVDEIGLIFNLSTSEIYSIIKENYEDEVRDPETG